MLATVAATAVALIFGAGLFQSDSVSMQNLDGRALRAGWRIHAARSDATDAGTLATPGDDDTVILSSPNIALSADTCATPLLAIGGPAVQSGVACMLEWTRRGDKQRYRVARSFDGDEFAARRDLAFEDLAFDAGWVGMVDSLTWTLHTGGQPVLLISAGAPATTGAARFALFARQWGWRDPIVSHTINTIRAPHIAGHSPAAWAAVAAGVALTITVAVAVARRRRVRPGMIVGILLTAWLANDTRWAAGQRQQLTADAQRFAEADSPETTAAALHPPMVAQAAWTLRRTLSPGDVYAVIGGDLAYGDRRLRYLLAPRAVQVNVDPLHPRVELERAQFVVILDDSLARVDPDGGVLRAEGFPAWRVQKVHQSSTGLLIVRRIP